MKFDKIVILVTFIPWILYFIEIMYYRIHMIEKFDLDGDKYLKYISKNLFKAINIKELILFFIFIIFSGYQSKLALKILFPTIYLYLLVDFFHTYANDCGRIRYYLMMALSVLLIIFVIIYFMITEDLYLTYSFMFIVSVLSAFIIFLFSKAVKEK